MLCVQFQLKNSLVFFFFFEVLGFFVGRKFVHRKICNVPVTLDIFICSMLQVILARMK